MTSLRFPTPLQSLPLYSKKEQRKTIMISEASPHEMSSPFFIQNRTICEEWEAFVNKLNGSIRGKYTSWALKMLAHISGDKQWNIDISKSTMSNAAIFFPSSKNLIEKTIFESTDIDWGDGRIKVWRSSLLSSLLVKIIPSRSRLNSQLLMSVKGTLSREGIEFIESLKNIAPDHKLESVIYNPKRKSLSISFNSILRDYHLVESLIR